MAAVCLVLYLSWSPPLWRGASGGARCGQTICAVSTPSNRFGGPPLRPESEEEGERPVALQGGWEVRTSRSGLEETWFELLEDGTMQTSKSGIGRGRIWRAEPKGNGWRLIVTVEDKLKAPLTFDGSVREDEYLGLSYTGYVMAPSKKTGMPKQVGEFRAWPASR